MSTRAIRRSDFRQHRVPRACHDRLMIDDFERCYRYMQSRDPRYDGHFFVAVSSTGIYCRPSCPARTPKRRNVRLLPSVAAAQSRGLPRLQALRPRRGARLAGLEPALRRRRPRVSPDRRRRRRPRGRRRPRARASATPSATCTGSSIAEIGAGPRRAGAGAPRADRAHARRVHRPAVRADRARRRLRQRAAVQRHDPRRLRAHADASCDAARAHGARRAARARSRCGSRRASRSTGPALIAFLGARAIAGVEELDGGDATAACCALEHGAGDRRAHAGGGRRALRAAPARSARPDRGRRALPAAARPRRRPRGDRRAARRGPRARRRRPRAARAARAALRRRRSRSRCAPSSASRFRCRRARTVLGRLVAAHGEPLAEPDGEPDAPLPGARGDRRGRRPHSWRCRERAPRADRARARRRRRRRSTSARRRPERAVAGAPRAAGHRPVDRGLHRDARARRPRRVPADRRRRAQRARAAGPGVRPGPPRGWPRRGGHGGPTRCCTSGHRRGAHRPEAGRDEFRGGGQSVSTIPIVHAREESIMSATYTFDVFSSLDGYGSASGGDWGGYWGKQGPEAARPPARPVRGRRADGVRGGDVSGVRPHADIEHRAVRGP